MKKLLIGIFLIGVVWIGTPEYVAATEMAESVVKIFVTANRMDYLRPWQAKGIFPANGSGSIVEGNKILTNAHVVSDHTFIQVKKKSDPKKYTAKVEAIGYDCDLALLSVDDPAFFEGVKPLLFGGLPKLLDQVTAIGYPQGGGKISITEGVVSRIEINNYAISSRKLLAVQIDAAINPGNSGGPVLQDGKQIGVVMQAFTSGQNIGYMIPMPIIQHFFDDLKDGQYDGFPILGIDFATTENKTMREYYQVEDYEGGIVVTNVLSFSPGYNIVKEGDVILKISGIEIGEDGTFDFRDNERLSIPYLITEKQVNENLDLEIVREGKIKKISVKMKAFSPLVGYPHHYEKPKYFIYGGLVFTALSTDLLKHWGNQWWQKAPFNLNYYLVGGGRYNKDLKKEIVVLLSVLPDDINVGYHNL